MRGVLWVALQIRLGRPFFMGAMKTELHTEPEFLCITQMLKATPAEEGGERYIYLEASNEALDVQNEVVLAKALEESASYYLRYGNIDLDHLTQVGAKAGIPDYNLFEIGRPVDVRVDGTRTFVKGQIFTGAGPTAEKANQFWDSITGLNPPQQWYPSVGGAVLEKSTEVDSKTKAKRSMVTRVRWTNIGMSKTPVNIEVPTASTIPFGVLAKCWGPGGLDLNKAIEAGYGTDSAILTGGGAMRKQSLHGAPANYWDFREKISGAMMKKTIGKPTASRLIDFAVSQYGCARDEAAEYVERLMRDVKRELTNRR